MTASYILGIAGASGSGKTTLARELRESLERIGITCNVIRIDDYYRAQTIPHEARKRVNYDHPGAVELDLAKKQLLALRNGERVLAPVYDFEKHNRMPECRLVEPVQSIIAEGHFALLHQLADCYDHRVFLDTPEETCVMRRIKRDIRERGRDLVEVLLQLGQTVLPGYREFVLPTKQFADESFPWDGYMGKEESDLLNRVKAVFRP